jgi:hypothetical protein
MILNRVQAASVLILATLFIVPSLAFPAYADVCYRAELFYEESAIGWAKLIVSDGKQFLKVEIEDFSEPGVYEVLLFKDYNGDYVAGNIEINEEGDAEDKFEIPYMNPDFQVIIKKEETEIRSGDWVECEKPKDHLSVKVSPSTLNLKSKGKWVIVKVGIQPETNPNDYKMILNGEEIPVYSVKETGNHITLKFSREDVQKYCAEGENIITISFKIGDNTIELTDSIRVIHGENMNTAQIQKGQNGDKAYKGKAKGKNK